MTLAGAASRHLHAFFTWGAHHSSRMDAPTNRRNRLHRLAAWAAARPYAIFLLAAAAMGIASVLMTMPPEMR